jgi:hypothetical protein
MKKNDFFKVVPIEPATKAIIELAEDQTGKGFEFIEKGNLTVSATVRMARQSMSHHIVVFKKENLERISHLIAHECGHIFRYFSVPKEHRLIPCSTRPAYEKAGRKIDAEGRAKLMKIPSQAIPQLKELWIQGLVRQLTNLPVDYRIEAWLYLDYPELRQVQRTSLNADYDQAIQSMAPEVHQITPDIIFNKSIFMNSAFYRALDLILGTSYHKAFEEFSRSRTAEKLFAPLQEADHGFEQDMRIIRQWTNILNLSDWFSWTDFENVPPDYAVVF